MNERSAFHLQQNYPNLLRAITLMRLTAWGLLALSVVSALGTGLMGLILATALYEKEPAQAAGLAAVMLVLAFAQIIVAVLAYIFAQAIPELLSLFASMEVGITTIAERSARV